MVNFLKFLYIDGFQRQQNKEVHEATNYNVTDIITPVNVERYGHLLRISNYNQAETNFL